MIRLAGSTFAFGNLSLEESSKILSDMGFSYADIGGCGWSSFAEWVPQQVVGNIDDSQGEGDRIRKITETHGLQISEFFICNFGLFITWLFSIYMNTTTQITKAIKRRTNSSLNLNLICIIF